MSNTQEIMEKEEKEVLQEEHGDEQEEKPTNRKAPNIENLKVDPGEGELVPQEVIKQRVSSKRYVEDLEEDGPDPEELDLAYIDKPIRGQKFTCISYVDPQYEVLEKKEACIMTHFLSMFLPSYTKKIITTIAKDYGLNGDEVLEKYGLATKVEDDPENFNDENWKKTKEIHENKIDGHFFEADVYDMLVKYKKYKAYNVVVIKKALKEQYPDVCFEKALKVRGAFSTYTKARKFAADLSRKDKTVNIFVIQTGAWVPFNPPQELIKKQVTINKQLNKLLWGYRKNQMYAEHFFNERKEEMIKSRVRKKSGIGDKTESKNAMFKSTQPQRPKGKRVRKRRRRRPH